MIDIEVRGRGAYDADAAARKYAECGIVILKGLLAPETQDEIRGLLESRLERARTEGGVLKFPQYPNADFLLGDILAIKSLEKYRYLFFQPEMLRVIRVLLKSERLVYFGDSSVQFGEAARGFHKDNVDRDDGSKEDWIGDYGLIRCGFYCQDHTMHSGGLKVRMRSHNIATHRRGRIYDVSSQYGDVVLWNMRLTHSGNARKLRFLPRLPLHPRLERVCPAMLAAPEQVRRISAFCAFGRPGPHTDRYVANLKVREADYKSYFQRARPSGEARSIAEGYGVTFLQPNDYYGEQYGLWHGPAD